MILEVATDKIDTEIGSSHKGVITKFFVKDGDVALIGKPICEIDTDIDTVVTKFTEKIKIVEDEYVEQIAKSFEEVVASPSVVASSNTKFYSPLVLNIAKKENISQAELDNIKGTGFEKRVTKDDILNYLNSKKEPKTFVSEAPVISHTGEDQIVEMDRMRKMISQRMLESKAISPHVTSFMETDMTAVVNWRLRIKDSFTKEFKENLTYTPILIEAVAHAIKKYPGINIQVSGDNIIYKKDINIGMAVALPNGNLIVPVIHQADKYSLSQLAVKVNDLAKRARNNQLKPEELSGGTYTITNIGTFGNLSGTPIIMQPQVAIMAFGVIRKLPSVIETPDGDLIGIRQKMVISHSFDHRVVDGSLGGLFLKEVSDFFENFDTKRVLN
jgi:2-oxoglutarate dehydrogenase E2 component (dihydrolipoamide succinyltransferase)